MVAPAPKKPVVKSGRAGPWHGQGGSPRSCRCHQPTSTSPLLHVVRWGRLERKSHGRRGSRGKGRAAGELGEMRGRWPLCRGFEYGQLVTGRGPGGEKGSKGRGKKFCSEWGTSEHREGLCHSGCSRSCCPLLLSRLPHEPAGIPEPSPGPGCSWAPFCALLSGATFLLWPFLQTVFEHCWAKLFSSNTFLQSHLAYELRLVSLLVPMKRAMLHPSLSSLPSLVPSRLRTCLLLTWLPSVYSDTGVLGEFLESLASHSWCPGGSQSEGRPFSMQHGSPKIHDNPVYSKQSHLDSG